MTNLAARRVSPFGHPGITAHVQLPQAYRSLSRPSSPLDAKASTVCLIAFDLKFRKSVAFSCDRKTQPVLIPHTRLCSSCGEQQTTTIHLQLSKSRSAPAGADKVKQCELEARSGGDF